MSQTNRDDIQIRRIFLEKDTAKIRVLQENAPEFKKHYPKHNQWLDFAIKEVIEGRRYAFGIYRTSFSSTSTSTPIVDLIGSIILKREIYTNSFELKNLYIAEDYREAGNGTALFEVVEQFCIKRGGIQIETEVPSIELNTVTFLSKRGFFVQQHSDSLFKSGDRIYKMVKKLPNKYTGDPFDLLNIAGWALENKYNFQILETTPTSLKYKVRLDNGLNQKSDLGIFGICSVIDSETEIEKKDIDSIVSKNNSHISSIIVRYASEELRKFCSTNQIFILELNQIKEHFRNDFSNDFQDFTKESIRGMIVPINYKYFKPIKDSHTGLTYFKGGPTGKFLKEGDYVIMCFEDSPDYANGGIKAYAKIEKSQIGSPDEIWKTYYNQNPIFPESDFMAWSVDKAEVLAFKIKDLKFINTISVREVTGQKKVTPYDNERLGQFYLNDATVNKFLELKEEINPSEFNDSSITKVFLSSTIEDLFAERTEITELVKHDLSYNIFASEYAGSFSQPRQTIIEEIQSSDVYICIVGQRYGFEADFDGRHISATHDEFNNAKRLNKKILVYAKNVSNREKKADDFLKEIGDYLKGQKFQKFSTAKELRESVKKDLARILKPS